MISAYPLFFAAFFLTLLGACAQFPNVDAAAPDVISPRPAYLSPKELAAVNAGLDVVDLDTISAAEDILSNRADDLRAQ